MYKKKKQGKQQNKKSQLSRLAEYESNSDAENEDGLFTREEAFLKEEDQKIAKYARKNQEKRAKTDSFTTNYGYSSKKRDISRRIDDEEDEGEEDTILDLDGSDVKGIIQDTLQRRSSLNKKNSDYFCSVLAQLILKNKINKENAFDIPLPDVQDMPDFFKVSEASWQKLSSSLDSGSKIYGYRVDSLHQESFKVLGGLIRSEHQYKQSDKDQISEDDGEDFDDKEDIIKKEREKLMKKQKKSHEETIEKNLSNITLTRYDIQFEVDPLFCKTSAKFDDASSKGILLNNIKIDCNLKLMMDSESIPGKLPISEEEPQEEEGKINRQGVWVFQKEVKDGKKQQSKVIDNDIIESEKKQMEVERYNSKQLLKSKQEWKEIIKGMRDDLNLLNLCSELDHFVSTMLHFDYSGKKLLKKMTDEGQEEDNNDAIIKDIASNQEDKQLMSDIQQVMIQTVQKRKKQIGGIVSVNRTNSDEINDYFETDNRTNEFSQRNPTKGALMSTNSQIEYNQQSEIEFNSQSQMISNQLNNYNYEYQNDDNIEYGQTPLDLFNEDTNNQNNNEESSQSNNNYLSSEEGISSSSKSDLGGSEMKSQFSLHSIALQISQIGKGTFFQNFEKDKSLGINPQDWKIQNQKKQISVEETKNQQNINTNNRRKRQADTQDSQFKFDFHSSEDLNSNEVFHPAILNKKKKPKPLQTNKSLKIQDNHLIGIDLHYKPSWLMKTTYLDWKELDEKEKAIQERQRKLEEEEQYRGFDGDDDLIRQTDEQTLLGISPLHKQGIEPKNDDNPNEDYFEKPNVVPFCPDDNYQSQDAFTQSQYNVFSQGENYSSTKDGNNKGTPFKTKQNIRKMKIQELKSKLWKYFQDSANQNIHSLEYIDLIRGLDLQKTQSASIQSCLVAILHLCNEHNLTLSQNSYDNFLISTVNVVPQTEEQEEDDGDIEK